MESKYKTIYTNEQQNDNNDNNNNDNLLNDENINASNNINAENRNNLWIFHQCLHKNLVTKNRVI